MAANTVWGLDFGNSAIKAVKMVRTGDACRIVDFDIIDIPSGGDDDRERTDRLKSAMATLTTTHRFGNDSVYIAVPGSVCLYREFQLPPGSENKLTELVQFEARQQIPFPLDQVEWGFEYSADANGISVALIAVRKSDIQDLLALLALFKLNLQGVAAAPTALFNFIQHEFQPSATSLILDAGAKGTDFVVMSKRHLYFRTIQIAGREITRILENKFKVPYEQAEDLKKNISQSPQMDKILTVIEPTLRQLSAEVQRTIGFYKSKSRGGRIDQCYLLGHTFRLPKMADFLQTQVREPPFAIVEGLQRVTLDDEINAEVWENEFPTMAVAIGLGIQGLGLGEVKLNLIPKSAKHDFAVTQWKKWAAAAAVVILASLGWSYYHTDKALTQYSQNIDASQKVVSEAKNTEEAAKAASSDIPAKEELVHRLSRIGHDRGKMVHIYDRLAGLRGADGHPVFGPETKMYLTNLYISRAPLGSHAGGLELNPAARSGLDHSENLAGPQSFYAPLAVGIDPQSINPELRPDIPLMVILSGEVAIDGARSYEARDKLQKLEDMLRRFPEVSDPACTPQVRERDVRTVTTEVQLPNEVPLEYNWQAELKTPPENTTASEANKSPYLIFHTIFCWDELNDRDIDPYEPPKEEAKGENKAKG